MSHPDDLADPAGAATGGAAASAAQRDAALRQLLEPDARTRLANIRMVKPDLAMSLENYLITMASQGRIQSQISDGQLKQMLLSMQQPKRDFRISRM